MPVNDVILSNNINNTTQFKEDDSETSSSSGSTSINFENTLMCSNPNLKNVNLSNNTLIDNRVVEDIIASLNGAVAGKDANIQYFKAIQNYPSATKISNNNSPSKANVLPKAPSTVTPHRLPQRTNDNDVCESPISSLVPHDRIFAHVPGRLSLLSNVVKYKVI